MYFVDQNRIETILTHMESLLDFVKNEPFSGDLKDRLALERVATVLIESIIDVGNQMIDGFIMRDPGGYEDIIDILLDEAVINAENAKGLKAVVRSRKKLAYEYTALQGTEVYELIKSNDTSLSVFPNDIRAYLKNELGVITAFLPNSNDGK